MVEIRVRVINNIQTIDTSFSGTEPIKIDWNYLLSHKGYFRSLIYKTITEDNVPYV